LGFRVQVNPRPAVNLLLDATANRRSPAVARSAGELSSAGSAAAPAATRGDTLFLAINGELQRMDQTHRLVRQVKDDLNTLRSELQSPDDESQAADDKAAVLRSSIAGIHLRLSDLASLRPPPASDTSKEDPVKEIGTIVNGLDPQSLAEPTSTDTTTNAIAQIDSALGLADTIEHSVNSERQHTIVPAPLLALAPRSDADALLLAKLVADGLRNTTDALGSRKLFSTSA